MRNRIIVSLAVLAVLAIGSSANAAAMSEAVAYWGMDTGVDYGTQLVAGDVTETQGTGGDTNNTAVNGTVRGGYGQGGASIGNLPVDDRGLAFAVGSLDFGIGASNELDVAGWTGMTYVGRYKTDVLSNYSLAGMRDDSNGWSYPWELAIRPSGSELRVLWYLNVSGTGNVGYDGSSDGLIATSTIVGKYITYAATYDGATGIVNVYLIEDDGTTTTLTKSTGATGTLVGGSTENMRIGAFKNQSGTLDYVLNQTYMDGGAVFNRALTLDEVKTLQLVPEPTTMLLLIGSGLAAMLLKRRR